MLHATCQISETSYKPWQIYNYILYMQWQPFHTKHSLRKYQHSWQTNDMCFFAHLLECFVISTKILVVSIPLCEADIYCVKAIRDKSLDLITSPV